MVAKNSLQQTTLRPITCNQYNLDSRPLISSTSDCDDGTNGSIDHKHVESVSRSKGGPERYSDTTTTKPPQRNRNCRTGSGYDVISPLLTTWPRYEMSNDLISQFK